MKKLTTALFALLLTTFAAFAGNPDAATADKVFDLDEAALAQEFAALDKIEAFVLENEGTTLSQLTAEHAEVLDGVTLIEDTSAVFTVDEMPLLGGFWWGCLLGIIGLALVYFITDNDRQEVKNALIGCVITTLLVGIGGFFF